MHIFDLLKNRFKCPRLTLLQKIVMLIVCVSACVFSFMFVKNYNDFQTMRKTQKAWIEFYDEEARLMQQAEKTTDKN